MALLDNRDPDRADMGGGFDVHERWGSGMTDQEREELIEKMAKAAWESDGVVSWEREGEFCRKIYLREARAALAVVEPVIREECAKIAEREANPDFETSDFLDGIAFGARVIAAAIREGGKE